MSRKAKIGRVTGDDGLGFDIMGDVEEEDND